jgi:hypothetical protein
MLQRTKIVSGLLVLLFLLAGCVVQLPAQAQATPSPTATGEEATGGGQVPCLESTVEQELVRNETAGYCFLMPRGYEAQSFEENSSMAVRAPVTSQGHRERLFIDVEEALGRTLAQVTDQVLIDGSIPGLALEVEDGFSVGGEPATAINQMPGQDLNRRVIVVHNGRVYKMMFMPDDPGMGQAYEEMEMLFAAVMESFRFMPPTAPMGLPLPDGQGSGYPEDAALSWERHIRGEGGAAECQRLVIAADGTTWAGSCEGVGVEAPAAPYQWDEIVSRFAPFVYRSGEWDLYFAGEGDVYHPAWQRALINWAQVTYGETVNGKISATGRTALSWWLGNAEGEADLCKHLVVLSHGYVYANVDPCAGGSSQTIAEGWLGTAEMEAFDSWLHMAAPTYREESYLDGRGEQELSEESIAELTEWAEHVYMRMVEQNP